MSRAFVSSLFIALLVLAEWYGFQAVRTVLSHASPVSRRVASVLYWLLTVAVWGVAIWAISTRRSDPATYKAYLGSLPLVFVAAKLVVLLFLLPEDLVRAGRWVLARFSSPAPAAGADAPAP